MFGKIPNLRIQDQYEKLFFKYLFYRVQIFWALAVDIFQNSDFLGPLVCIFQSSDFSGPSCVDYSELGFLGLIVGIF